MRVLYVNHTSHVSGAEQSLLLLLRGVSHAVHPVLACPPGPLQETAGGLGIPVCSISGTDGSLRLHPLHTARTVVELGRAARTIRSLGKARPFDLVHGNSIRAGIPASLAARLGGPPAVVHVRDCLPPSPVAHATFEVIRRGASAVLANSRHTADQINEGNDRRLHVIHNPVDLACFDPGKVNRADARQRIGIPESVPVLAVLAQLTPWKGQDDAIRALALLRKKHPGAQLLLIGSTKFVSRATRYDNRAYLRTLKALVEALDLCDSVRFMGEREDIPQLLRATDILMAPSWEEPFGRAVVEGMAMGVPVIATDVGGPTEIVRDGEDGWLLPPRDPARWASAALRLIEQPELRRSMALHGRRRAQEFSVEHHAAAVLEAYRRVLGTSPRAQRRAWVRRQPAAGASTRI